MSTQVPSPSSTPAKSERPYRKAAKKITPLMYRMQVRRRRDRKPWMWFEDGLWFCCSNVGVFPRLQMITAINESPRRAYARWEWLRKLSEEVKQS